MRCERAKLEEDIFSLPSNKLLKERPRAKFTVASLDQMEKMRGKETSDAVRRVV